MARPHTSPATRANTKVFVPVALVLVLAVAGVVAFLARDGQDGPPSPTTAPAPAPRAGTEPPPAQTEPAAPPVVTSAPPAPPGDPAKTTARGATQSVKVDRVIDATTLHVIDGREVVLFGIHIPEGDDLVEAEAHVTLRDLVDDELVTLEQDVELTDAKGRALAYVLLGDVFVNGELVRRGLAYFRITEPNVTHDAELAALQKEARDAKRGLWSRPAPEPEESYVGDRSSHRFHRPKCRRAERLKNRKAELATRDAAFDGGFVPCKECKP